MTELEFVRVISIYQAGLDRAINSHAWETVRQLSHEIQEVVGTFSPPEAADNYKFGREIQRLITQLIRTKAKKFSAGRPVRSPRS